MAYKDVILATPGLKDYWRMGAGASEVSSGPNAATLTHANTPGTASSLVPTDSTGARTYNGSTQLSSISGYTGWSSAPGISMECWFQESALVTWGVVMGHENHPTSRFFMLRNSNTSTMTAGFADSSKSLSLDCNSNPAPYTQFAVTYCAVTMGAAGLLIYINGLLAGWNLTPLTGNTSAWSIPVGIGGADSPSFIGANDEPAMYNVELSAGTIMRHWKAGKSAGFTRGLLLPV